MRYSPPAREAHGVNAWLARPLLPWALLPNSIDRRHHRFENKRGNKSFQSDDVCADKTSPREIQPTYHQLCYKFIASANIYSQQRSAYRFLYTVFTTFTQWRRFSRFEKSQKPTPLNIEKKTSRV